MTTPPTAAPDEGVEHPDIAHLVETKFDIPARRPGLVDRRSLITRLIGSTAPLTLVSAPAGWGKSSLVAEWLDQVERRIAWVSLDSGDDDPTRFWMYVAAALRRALEDDTVDPTAVRDRAGTVRREVIPRIISAIGAAESPVTVVLDDYHLISDPTLHDDVDYLIDHLPGGARFVIATRSDPPLSLARRRAQGDLVEIRSTDLRFTPDEIETVLNDKMGLGLSAKALLALDNRTEGWPAGIYLAGLSLRDRPEPEPFVSEFAGDNRHVADYLTEQVLKAQPAERRTFLLHTSILDRLSGALCDAVTRCTPGHSQAVLEEIERDNLFLIPLDSERRWWRYHHLFAEWLRHELRRTTPELVPELHRRAHEWHRERNSFVPSIDHALEAGEQDAAADILERALYFVDYGRPSVLTPWLEKLGDERISARPGLALGKAADALFSGDPDTAERWLTITEAGVDPKTDPSMAADLAVVEAFLWRIRCDIRKAANAARRAISFADSARPASRALADRLHSGISFWALPAVEAIPLVEDSIRLNKSLGLPDQGHRATLAALYAEAGRWDEAEAAVRSAFSAAEDVAGQYPVTALAHFARAQIRALNEDLDGARAAAQRGIELSEGYGDPMFVAYGLGLLVEWTEDLEEARRLLLRATTIAGALPDPGRLTEILERRQERLRNRSNPDVGGEQGQGLTGRELDVLRLLRSRLSLREIGRELYISHNTVKGYTKNLYRKLGVSSRKEAVAVARDLGIL